MVFFISAFRISSNLDWLFNSIFLYKNKKKKTYNYLYCNVNYFNFSDIFLRIYKFFSKS